MDYSREIKCNNSQGGVKEVYVMPYVDYLDSQISVINNVLTRFPYNIIYRLNAFNINFNTDAKQDKDVEYSEKISFQLKKLLESDNFKQFVSRDWRVIVKDNNSKIRMFGLRNGLIGSYKEDSGTGRADFNGYSFNFEGKEEDTAPYIYDLSIFNIMPIEGLLLENGLGVVIEDGNTNYLTN
jgi:hypothetical protein